MMGLLKNEMLGIFVGYGFAIGIGIGNMFGAAFLYQFSMIVFLPIMLRHYDLKLFAADPATSKLLSHLYGELGFFVYFISAYSALFTLAGVAGATSQVAVIGIFLVLLFWLPIIVLFTANQTSLASIIRRAKWKTLNEIQSQVEELRTMGSLKDKETMEAIYRLMDFHDRVKATRNSAIDSNTILNFINSLLLPLLAFILGNLDKVLLLFSSKP